MARWGYVLLSYKASFRREMFLCQRLFVKETMANEVFAFMHSKEN